VVKDDGFCLEPEEKDVTILLVFIFWGLGRNCKNAHKY